MSHVDHLQMRPHLRLASIPSLRHNPLDVFERLCIGEHYDHDREGVSRLHLYVPGLWCHHDITLKWSPEDERLSLFLAFGDRYPGGRSDDMCRLMSLASSSEMPSTMGWRRISISAVLTGWLLAIRSFRRWCW